MKVGDLVKMIDKDNPNIKSWGLNVGVIIGKDGDRFLIKWAATDRLWLLYPEEIELINMWEYEGCNPNQFINPDKDEDK